MHRAARINWKAFSAIGLGTLVVPLDSSVNVAFPFITAAFGVPHSAIQWVIVCYVISYATLLLVFGRVGDLFGHAAVFRAGLVICALSFAGSGMARSLDMLLASRAFQGVGAAMVMSCGPALATSVFRDNQRLRALGSYAAIFGLGIALGPILGGILIESWNWSAVFWFRVPISLTAVVLTLALAMPEQGRAVGRFDAIGALALVTGLGALLIGVSRARYGTLDWKEIAAYAGLMAGAALIFRSSGPSREGYPGAFSVFRKTSLLLVTMTGVAVNMVWFAVMLFAPFYLARLTALPAAVSGLVLAASPIGIVVAGQCGPFIVKRLGPKLAAFAGAVGVAVGTAWIGTWDAQLAVSMMAVSAFVQGAGLGLYQVAQLEISTTALPRQSRGVAGSLVMLTNTVGVVLSASALTALFVFLESIAAAQTADGALLAAFQQTFFISAGVLAAVLLLTLAFPGNWFRSAPK